MPAAAASSQSELLKQRIGRTLAPRLIADLLRGSATFPGDRDPSLAQRAEAERQANRLLLRLVAIAMAEAREMLSPADRARWRRLRAVALRHDAGTAADQRDELRRQLDACVQRYGETLGNTELDKPDTSRIESARLAQVIVGVTRADGVECTESGWLDYGLFEPRLLGELYEMLLANPTEAAASHGNRQTRKANGVFYTPAIIVDYIVAETLGPLMEERLALCQRRLVTARNRRQAQRMIAQGLDLRVLDPAMGAGYFVVAAAQWLAARLRKTLASVPSECRPAERFIQQAAVQAVFGIDIDPLAVELARASLWLQCRLTRRDAVLLGQRLQTGNALTNEQHARSQTPFSPLAHRVDAVIGNPPYGATLSATELALARRQLPQMRHNRDSAVGFIERADRLLGPGGRCGLIVPKALTYSFAWRRLRESLAGRVAELIDVSCAWPEVRLEQVILLFRDTACENSALATYHGRSLMGNQFTPRLRVAWRLAQKLDAWPCGLSLEECRLAERLSAHQRTLGDLCRTFRGLPMQGRLSAHGDIGVLGGRDVARWRVRGRSGFVSRGVAAAACAGPRLLFQNIIAHVTKPKPCLKLIGCHDLGGPATLDTVNTVVARHSDCDLHGVLGLLHSDFANWYVHAVIYNRAVRTMHFDQYFLNKIPLTTHWRMLLERLAPLARSVEQSCVEQAEIAFRLSRAARNAGVELPAAAAETLLAITPQRPRRVKAMLAGLAPESLHNLETLARRHAPAFVDLGQRRQQYERQLNDSVNVEYGWRPS